MKLRTCLKIVLTAILLVSSAVRADDLLRDLSDPDVKVRESAWEALAAQKRELNADQIVSIVPQGLRDSDPSVRHNAIAVVVEKGAESRIRYKKFLFSSHPEITKPLLDLLHDSDRDVRQVAIPAVIYALEPTPELEKTLLNAYDHEKDSPCREQLISVLLTISGKQIVSYNEHEPTQRVVDLFVEALDDPNDMVRAQAAQAISQLKNPPLEVLPKLADRLDVSQWGATQFYLAAIARYGAAAQCYLPKLKQMQTDVENLDDQHGGKTLRWNVDNAIRLIHKASEK
jgi:HEAT repeat protein